LEYITECLKTNWISSQGKYIKESNFPLRKRGAKNIYRMYSILIEDEFGMSRHELMEKLEEKGIERMAFFIPAYRQPVFLNVGLFTEEVYPVAEELEKRGLYLTSSSGVTEGQISHIRQTIKEIKWGRQRR
jgi:perosamine synthetase